MKTMKHALLAAMLIAGASAFAQPGPEKENCGAAFQQAEPIMKQLNLTEEQQQKLAEIREADQKQDAIFFNEFRKQQEKRLAKRQEEFKSILNKEQLEQYEKMQAACKEATQGCKTPKMQQPDMSDQAGQPMCGQPFRQQDQFEEKCPFGEQNRFEKQGRFDQPGNMDKAPITNEAHAIKQTDRLVKLLGLDDEQAMKVLTINRKYVEKDSLRFAEKGEKGDKKELVKADREALKKDMLAEKEAKSNEIKAILKPYQKVKFENMEAMARPECPQKMKKDSDTPKK